MGKAADLLSGPGGLASFLRRRQLGARLGGPSLPLDIGYAETVPAGTATPSPCATSIAGAQAVASSKHTLTEWSRCRLELPVRGVSEGRASPGQGLILAHVTTPPEAQYATATELARFTHSQLLERHLPSPGVSALTYLFRTMYAASMATEEGQKITFEVTWIDPNNPDPNRPRRIVADRWTTVPFSSSMPLTTRSIIKAARATDPRTSSFAVYVSKDETIFIWGMIDQGNRAYDFARYDSEYGPDRPGVFQASAVGTGHLTVSIGYEPIAELRIDRLFGSGLDALRVGPIFEAVQPGLNEFVEAIREAVPNGIYDDRPHWDLGLGSKWMETLARVLLRIRGMGHGGAVLITPDTSGTELDIKYKITYDRLPQALRRWGSALIRETYASDLIGEAINDYRTSTIEAGTYLDENVHRVHKEAAANEIDGIIWFVACLSRVDGLILMNPDLAVKGFGTIITVEDAPSAVFAAQDELAIASRRLPLSYDAFGTRHRSMMRYCHSHAGSVGFVISQDGDIRAMAKVGQDLVVWDGVRLQRVLLRDTANEPIVGPHQSP